MLKRISQLHDVKEPNLFWGFAFITFISIALATVLYNPLPLIAPLGLLFALFCINSPKQIFYLFFLLLPFSIEIHLGSFGTDLPSEPLMIILMAVSYTHLTLPTTPYV